MMTGLLAAGASLLGILLVVLAYILVRGPMPDPRVWAGDCHLCRHSMWSDDELSIHDDALVHTECRESELNRLDYNRTNYQEP